MQREVLSLYLKILYQVEGMPNVHSGVINKNDNMDENNDVDVMMLMMLAMLLTFHPKPTSASDQPLSLSQSLYKHKE